MFETNLTVVGVVTAAPWRLRSERTGVTGAKLRLLSTSRRYDKTQGQWVDGDRLFVEVVCWRDLAEHVCESVFKGDPLIVTGRLYTRDFEVDGRRRWAYEIDATAVGHDMTRGISHFNRPEPGLWPAGGVDPVNGEETPTAARDEGVPLAGGASEAEPPSTVDLPGVSAARRAITPPAVFAA